MTLSDGLAAAVKAVRYIREHDCDFLTVDNVRDYSGQRASRDEAIAALKQEMGEEWYARTSTPRAS